MSQEGIIFRPLGPGVVAVPPSKAAPALVPFARPVGQPESPRRRKLAAAVVVSAVLHAAAALAITASSLGRNAQSAGDAGQDLVSQPSPPPVMVELLTLADLVSDATPEINADGPASLDAPVPPEDLPVAPLAETASPALPMTSPQPLLAETDALPALSKDVAELPAPPPKPAKVAAPAEPAAVTPPKAKPKAADKPAKKKPAAVADAGGVKAAGSGGAEAAGQDGTAKVASLSASAAADLKASWGAEVRGRVERKKAYPRGADGASGTVKVRLTVARSGKLISVEVVSSSGSAQLDKAAVKAVKAAGRFPKAPEGLGEKSYSFTLPMKFAP